MKSFEGSFCNLNFSPSTSILLNFFFPFIDIRCFFCQVLQYSRTIVLLKKLKPLKKPLFQKRRWSCDFPPRKTPVAQKHRAISRQEKMAFSIPPSGCLGTPLPLPQIRKKIVRYEHQNFFKSLCSTCENYIRSHSQTQAFAIAAAYKLILHTYSTKSSATITHR